MNSLIKLETKKLLKTKRTWVVSIALFSLAALAIYLCYKQIRDVNDEGSIFYYAVFIFEVNQRQLYPILLAIFFSPIITEEFSLRTIYLLKGSSYRSDQWLIAKFVSGIFVFASLFILVMLISLAFCQFILLDNPLVVDAGTFYISVSEIIFRLVAAVSAVLVFLVCLASLIVLISLITRNYLFTVFITFLIIALNTFLPIPEGMQNYIFLNAQDVGSTLGDVNFPWSHVLNGILVDAATMVLSLMISLVYVNKIEMNR